MAIQILWSAPRDTGWLKSRIYRASSKDGNYELIAWRDIGTFSYIDSLGSSSFWYKTSFYNGINESSLSDPVQGGTSANYCSLQTLRDLTPFSSSDIPDTSVIALMPICSRIVHRKIIVKRFLERDLVGPIDGSNTIFYTKHKPLADMDMDSDVDISDVQVFYATLDGNNRRVYGSLQTVSSVSARDGTVTMQTAPTSVTAIDGLYITYGSTVEDLDYSEVREAADYMLAHYCSLKIRGETPTYKNIETPYLRKETTGQNIGSKDEWQHPYLKASLEIIREIMGKGKKGVGFSRVDAPVS